MKCVICGTIIGEVIVSSKFGWNANTATEQKYKEENGIVDNRCTECETIHGSFKKLTEEYINKTGKDPMTAENFVKANRKRVDFDRELEKELKKLK